MTILPNDLKTYNDYLAARIQIERDYHLNLASLQRQHADDLKNLFELADKVGIILSP